MTHRAFISFFIPLLAIWISGPAPLAGQVMPANERLEILQKAAVILKKSSSDPAPDPADVLNPFYPPLPPEAPEPEKADAVEETELIAIAPDREILETVAEQIRPGGRIQYQGRTFLLFGEARFGIDDLLAVNYRGSLYEIEIVDIQPEFFLLRLNDETIQKPLR